MGMGLGSQYTGHDQEEHGESRAEDHRGAGDEDQGIRGKGACRQWRSRG